MSKESPEALLEISPQSELKFKGPFTEVVVSEIHLHNISQKNACFKIKTTAPKQYCVRPNCGIVEPGKTVIVTVMLQPFTHDAKEKVKHKFLVLSMPAPDEPVDSVEQLWKDPPTDKVFDVKLRCVFDVPSEAPSSAKEGKQDLKDRTDDDLVTEHKKLIEENRKLKQDSQRLRKMMMGSSTSNYISLGRSSEPGAISLLMAGFIAVIAIVFGLVLGKFVV